MVCFNAPGQHAQLQRNASETTVGKGEKVLKERREKRRKKERRKRSMKRNTLRKKRKSRTTLTRKWKMRKKTT